MMALMCLRYFELGDQGKAARLSRITGRANVQREKDEYIGGRGSNLKCLPRWASRENEESFEGRERGER